MNIAGVLVCVDPARVDTVCQRLGALAGVDVHFGDESGRVIVTIEGDGVEQDIARLRAVKAVDGVLSAEMVHYQFDEDDAAALAAPDSTAAALEHLDSEAAPASFYQRLKRQSNF